MDYALDPNSIHLNIKVWKVIDQNGKWNFSLIQNAFPNDVIMKLCAYHPPIKKFSLNNIIWKNSEQGHSFISSANELIHDLSKEWNIRLWSLYELEGGLNELRFLYGNSITVDYSQMWKEVGESLATLCVPNVTNT